MRKIALLLILVSVAFFLNTSCSSGDKGELKGFKKTKTGLLYKFHERGDGEVSPVEGDFLDLVMVYGTEDSVLFDSRQLPISKTKKIVPMGPSIFQGDIYEGLGMMVVGDSMTLALNADSVWTKLFRLPASPPGMDSLDYIYFHLKLNEIVSADEMQRRKDEEARAALEKERVNMENYLRENYPDAIPAESGLYYYRRKIGTGDLPKTGQMVKVHYTGYFLDGTKFESSYDRGEPYEFRLGLGQVIPGWDEGVGYMRKGELGVLILPSKLAYGERGSPGGIPPYTPLVFELEMVDFYDLKK